MWKRTGFTIDPATRLINVEFVATNNPFEGIKIDKGRSDFVLKKLARYVKSGKITARDYQDIANAIEKDC